MRTKDRRMEFTDLIMEAFGVITGTEYNIIPDLSI